MIPVTCHAKTVMCITNCVQKLKTQVTVKIDVTHFLLLLPPTNTALAVMGFLLPPGFSQIFPLFDQPPLEHHLTITFHMQCLFHCPLVACILFSQKTLCSLFPQVIELCLFCAC